MAVNQKPFTKALRVIASLLIVGHSFMVLSVPQVAKAAINLGDGSAENPYRITTCADISEIAGSNAHYALMNNIDCTGVTLSPIATFPGTLDGRNLTIDHLTISSVGDNVGLINWLNGGTVKNLAFTNGSISGRNYVGTLASQVSAGATISNVSVVADVTGNVVAGGIVGLLAGNATITRSSYAGTVTATTSNGGGIAGFVDTANINNSYAQALVTGGSALGLLAGSYGSSTDASVIANSYVSGSVENGTNRAAFIGVISGSDSISINNIMISANANGGSALYKTLASGPVPSITNIYFNGSALGSNIDCVDNSMPIGCNAFNTDGQDPFYHLNNHTNAPFNSWDFDTIWQTTLTQPTLRTVSLDAITSISTPSAPTNMVVTPSVNGASVFWGNPENDGGAPITGWSIQIREHGSPSWDTVWSNYGAEYFAIGIGGGNQVLGAHFDYRIAANNAIGTGEYAEVDNVQIGDVPMAPQNFVGSNNVTGVGGFWDAPAYEGSTPVTHYQFGYSVAGDNSWNTYDVGGNSAGINGLNSGVYDLRVRAINDNGAGDWNYVYGFYVGPEDISISSCQDLQGMQDATEAHYTLAQDIDCSDSATWNDGEGFMPITDFSGSLDGAGHTINHLTINRDQWGQALFAYTNSDSHVDIHDLTINNASVTAFGEGAVLVAYPYDLTVDNVVITNSSVHSDYTTGGMFAYTELGNEEQLEVSNCTVSVTLNHAVNDDQEQRGGIMGYLYMESDSGFRMHDTTINITSQDATSTLGGALGGIDAYDNSTFVINDTTVNGDIEGGNAVGGLIGYYDDQSYNNPFISSVTNNASLAATDQVGGLVGFYQANNGSLNIDNSRSTGAITASNEDAYAGGLVGLTNDTGDASELYISRSYSTGNITTDGGDYVGGLVGSNVMQMHIVDSYYRGTLTGFGYIGGLVGYSVNDTSSILSSYAVGTINSSPNGLMIGGIAGEYMGTIDDNFAAVAISSSETSAGGIVGAWDDGESDNNYVD